MVVNIMIDCLGSNLDWLEGGMRELCGLLERFDINWNNDYMGNTSTISHRNLNSRSVHFPIKTKDIVW